MTDFWFIIIILFIPLIAQGNVVASFNKYKAITNTKKLSGQEVASKILEANDLKNVYVVQTSGSMSDHYDPSRKVVRLSNDVYNGTSITAMAVAAHEVGHAIQDKEGYLYLKLRSLIFPIVNFGTGISYFVILIGVLTDAMDLVMLGIVLTSLGLIFQVVTLPVEFNASARAKSELDKIFNLTQEESNYVSKVLGAAALTYVAGVLASALEVLRLVMRYYNND